LECEWRVCVSSTDALVLFYFLDGYELVRGHYGHATNWHDYYWTFTFSLICLNVYENYYT